MRIKSSIGAAALAAAIAFSAAIPLSAGADEAEVLAHYDAYEAAMAQLRYDVADTEAEAAWRGAEETWGGIEDTAVLAFNLVRVRLMGDRRAEAIEPALRIVELAQSGNAQSVTPAEVTLFSTLAQFDATDAGRGEVGELEAALSAYAPTDYVGKRIALLGWSYAANARARHGQYYDSGVASQNALALAAEDPTTPMILVSAVAIIGARAGYETGDIGSGILAAKRGIAAFPTVPSGQPLDIGLANLLIWDQALNGVYLQEEGHPYAADPSFADPKWDDGRYVAASCMPQWVEAPEGGGFGGPRPDGMGAVFEYRLSADGGVTDLSASGAGADTHPFAEALRAAKAEAPASECQGLHHQVVAFLAPKERTSGTR